jgi:nonsense-mediated mRNA decay protein 3
MFCVECGREERLYHGLCSKCFLQKNKFTSVPKIIDSERCVHCSSRKKGKGWISVEDEDNVIHDVIFENVKTNSDVSDFDVHINPEYENENNVNVDIIIHAIVGELKAEEEHKTKIRFRKTVCDECSKQQGGYWESKVQLRGAKKGLEDDDYEKAFEIVDLIIFKREKKDRDAFVTKIEKIHNGLDFYLGSKKLGKIISKELMQALGGHVKESHKLMGRQDGKDVYRTTYLVRLFEFRVQDFLKLDDTIFQVKKISSDGVLLRTLSSGKDFWFSESDLEKAKILGGPENIKEMVVVSRGDGEIQVLDPGNLKTVDVLVPEGYDTQGESISVVKFEEGYFLIDRK